MNISWKNTRTALTNFGSLLACNKCGSKPISAIRYTTCGHFFCKLCIGNDSDCTKCGTPVRPIDMYNDHIIESLVSYCDSIAEIIQEKNVWNTATNTFCCSQISKIVSQPGSKVGNRKHFIPKRNINKPNAKGETLLHIACLRNQEDYVRTLLAAGANPNTKDNAHWTPLQEVVIYGYITLCQLLLECGASPNTPGNDNRTALHDAAINNRLDEAKLLLKYHAKRDVFDKYGKKPIDYCLPSTEMSHILQTEEPVDETFEEVVNLNRTLDQSFSQSPFIIYASNLDEQNRNCLDRAALKHRMKITSTFRSSVTHVIFEANSQNVAKLSYDVMLALLRGTWLLSCEWIHLALDLSDVSQMDLELFEISGAPVIGTPKKARENKLHQNPGLFNQCHFYFTLHPRNTYCINEVELTVDGLTKLVTEGNGRVLIREPNPEDVKNEEEIIPFHVADKPHHPLYKCIYYIIYVPSKDESPIKYNMPHIKTLPLIWLIECIEKFTLVDPSHLGLP